jgi:transposase
MKRRRKFDPSFKREAVNLFRSSGRGLSDVARELGIGVSVLRAWVMKDDAQPEAVGYGDRDELLRLRKENARLKEDVEILKKATAFFAKERT